jgi:hypothetical protein
VRMKVAIHKRTPRDLLEQMRGDPWDHINEEIEARLRESGPQDRSSGLDAGPEV